MIFRRLKLPDEEELEQHRKELREEEVSGKELHIMSLTALAVILPVALLVLVGLSLIVMLLFGVL